MTDKTDSKAFLEEIFDVKPLRQDTILKESSPSMVNSQYRQKAAQSFETKDENFLTDGEVPKVEPNDILSYKMTGVQPNVFKKLKQGKYACDYHLDLHRKTVSQAREAVFQLFKSAIKFNYRSLMITHGKGMKSKPPARLKGYINHWLQQIDIVLAFHSAKPQHGGTGSVYILLKKTQPTNKINQAKYD